MWKEWKFNSKKLVTCLLIRRRKRMIFLSWNIQKWVYIHENVMIPVCIKTHFSLTCSKSETFAIGFRGRNLWLVKAAFQMISLVNENYFAVSCQWMCAFKLGVITSRHMQKVCWGFTSVIWLLMQCLCAASYVHDLWLKTWVWNWPQ